MPIRARVTSSMEMVVACASSTSPRSTPSGSPRGCAPVRNRPQVSGERTEKPYTHRKHRAGETQLHAAGVQVALEQRKQREDHLAVEVVEQRHYPKQGYQQPRMNGIAA